MERRYEAYTVSGTQQLFEKFERDQKADQNLLEELAQKLPKESAVVNTQITLTRSLIDLFKIATKQEQYDIVHYLFANLYVDFDKYCLTAFEPKAEFDFLFSTFAPLNGWKKEGPRYLLPCHYQLPEEQNQDDKDKRKDSEQSNKIISRKQLAAMHGFFLNSKAPFGYKKSDLCDPVYPDSRILIIDEPAASAVRKCYELYSNGDNSYSDLAKMLNKQGFISTSGGSFNRETIRLMLSNPAYNGEDGDFEREATNIEDYDLPYVKQISLINKVREVQALTGFTRVHPAERNEKKITKNNIVSVKEDPDTEWYPAYQVKGEGIFIEFSHDAIEEWITNNPEISNRVERLNTKYRESYMGQYTVRNISAKFLLLHTISHLLIKRLSFECGYSIASLRERIYCDRDGDSDKMSGIFIYTASGDSEGTLGGLVRQGRSDTFPKIFKRAMIEAKTCSNDPVCSLSTGQGRDSLNLAACYSCTLIPETSCEEFNIFLDRCSVVGTLDRPEIGFYSNHVLGMSEWHCTEKADNRNDREKNKKTSKSAFQITDYGIDYENESYNKIWGDVFAWANDKETVLLNQLQNNTSLFTNKEKPHAKCKFTVGSDQKEYNCDLVWKESKVALFTESYEDSYTEAVKTDWNCFYSCDPAFDINSLAAKIKSR